MEQRKETKRKKKRGPENGNPTENKKEEIAAWSSFMSDNWEIKFDSMIYVTRVDFTTSCVLCDISLYKRVW